jgi:hypothetical protein
MRRIVARYYRGPDAGLDEELRFGNVVYYIEADAGVIGAFLIVNLDHHRAEIAGREHRFTYLGLGCAEGCPMPPVFRQVRDDVLERLDAGFVGVLHLTTRTPYAFRGLEKAFPGGIVPGLAEDSPHDLRIAAYIKEAIHRHPRRSERESPFVLRELKKGRFSDTEVARIRGFQGSSPIARFGVDCEGSDEVIVFHRFAA